MVEHSPQILAREDKVTAIIITVLVWGNQVMLWVGGWVG